MILIDDNFLRRFHNENLKVQAKLIILSKKYQYFKNFL